MNPTKTLQAIQTHKKLRETLLDQTDLEHIPLGNKITRIAINHTGYLKLAQHYQLTHKTTEKQRIRENNATTWIFTIQAQTPEGTKATTTATCTTNEPNITSEHDCLRTAQIRATNQAISTLIDYGAKSAEEYTQNNTTKQTNTPPEQTQPEQPSTPQSPNLERITTTLTANGINPKTLQINETDTETTITTDNPTTHLHTILTHLGATHKDNTYTIPHPTPHIWTIQWKTRDKQPIPENPDWAWAYIYNPDNTIIPEHRELVEYLQQHGKLVKQGYTLSLGGRDKRLLQLRRNKAGKQPG